MINYQWSVSPGGTIVSGINQSKVTVNWHGTGTQYVYCNYTSPYGCPITQSTFKVGVWNLPVPTITGEEIVNLGSTWRYTTEPGMNSYVWNVSSGGFISGGGGSSSYYADITWEGTGQQFVSVNYANAGRCTASSPAILDVFVNGSGPSGPVSNQITNTGIDIISGQSENLNKHGIPDFSIYPVPNDGKFTIAFNSDKKEIYTVLIYNSIGVEVYKLKDISILGTHEMKVDISSVTDGVYIILIKNSEGQKSRRILIKK
jgi:hypothetical protein